MSSQSITSRIYQRLLYLMTNQIAHQGFWIFNWLPLPLDSEDGFRTGCRNVSHLQQSFSGLQSPRWSFSIKVFLSLLLLMWLNVIYAKLILSQCVQRSSQQTLYACGMATAVCLATCWCRIRHLLLLCDHSGVSTVFR